MTGKKKADEWYWRKDQEPVSKRGGGIEKLCYKSVALLCVSLSFKNSMFYFSRIFCPQEKEHFPTWIFGGLPRKNPKTQIPTLRRKLIMSLQANIVKSQELHSFISLVLPSPAWPYWRKSGLNRCFCTTISSIFAKILCYIQSSHWCSLLKISLNLSGLQNMGSFLLIVVTLYIYIYSDIGNIRKIKYFHDYFRHSRKAWNTITQQCFIIYTTYKITIYLYTCKYIFNFNYMGLNMTCTGMCVRGIARYN